MTETSDTESELDSTWQSYGHKHQGKLFFQTWYRAPRYQI